MTEHAYRCAATTKGMRATGRATANDLTSIAIRYRHFGAT
jgi:hypothetical protein